MMVLGFIYGKFQEGNPGSCVKIFLEYQMGNYAKIN